MMLNSYKILDQVSLLYVCHTIGCNLRFSPTPLKFPANTFLFRDITFVPGSKRANRNIPSVAGGAGLNRSRLQNGQILQDRQYGHILIW